MGWELLFWRDENQSGQGEWQQEKEIRSPHLNYKHKAENANWGRGWGFELLKLIFSNILPPPSQIPPPTGDYVFHTTAFGDISVQSTTPFLQSAWLVPSTNISLIQSLSIQFWGIGWPLLAVLDTCTHKVQYDHKRLYTHLHKLLKIIFKVTYAKGPNTSSERSVWDCVSMITSGQNFSILC